MHENVHRPENGLSVSVEDTHFGDSGEIEAVLVNTNQVERPCLADLMIKKLHFVFCGRQY